MSCLTLQPMMMQDVGRNHTTRLVENCLETETVQHMESPECSPDRNLIKHAWSTLGRRVAARLRLPLIIQDMEITLRQKRNNISECL
ncbi:hypothetical protein TNCV_3018941 [Trichonephila clavipes]|nr:hypothetical protein TNCV_3018941 [Trichonephila clavipes]